MPATVAGSSWGNHPSAPVGVALAQAAPATPPAQDAPAAERPPAETSRWVEYAKDPWKRGGIEIGGVFAIVDSGVQVGPNGIGVVVDLEEAFDMKSSVAVGRLGGFWRFSKNRRHRADLSWMAMRRSSEKTLGEDLDLGGGPILPGGTEVGVKMDLDILRATYSYSFLQDDRVDLAATAGLYVMPIDFGFAVSGVTDVDESFKVTAPLPLFGLRADFLLTPRWYLRSSLSLFYLEVGDYTGNMRELRTSVEWMATKWLGIGAGVETFGLGVKAGGSTDIPGVDFLGTVNFDYAGAVLYARGYL